MGPSYAAAAAEEDSRRVAALLQQLENLEKQKLLHESDHQFRLLVEAVQDYAIFMLDPQGRVQSWNVGAERIKGYQASEIIGRHFSCFYPEEDAAAGKPQRALDIAARDGRFENEGWRIRKDGSKFWADVTITALKDSTGKLVGFGKVTRDFTEEMLAARELEDSQRKLQESEHSLRQLSRHLLRTQDEERRRIGRDLHDSLGQHLSVMKMKLDSLRLKTNGNQAPQDDEELNLCSQMIDDAVKEVRTLSYLLYPPMLEEMGLRSAALWYLDGFMKRSGINTTFTASPDFPRVPAEIELALFRVLQECLTNVHRQSGSPTADVHLGLLDGSVVLQVRDSGKGMTARSKEQPGQSVTSCLGVGLRGMSERIRQLGGSLEFATSSTGTLVSATVPLPL